MPYRRTDDDQNGAASRSSSCRECRDLELLRDGVVIAGLACRLTVGTFILLRSAGVRGFCGGDDVPTAQDYIDALYFMADETRDEAVWVAASEHQDRILTRWRKRFCVRDAVQVADYLTRLLAVMPDEDGASAGRRDDTWFLGLVDLFAHQYHWSRDYILWSLPYPVAVRLRDRILARLGAKDSTTDISPDVIRLLEERDGDKGKA